MELVEALPRNSREAIQAEGIDVTVRAATINAVQEAGEIHKE